MKPLRKYDNPWDHWYHTTHWRKLRKMILARDPICMVCQHAPSKIADHKIPHKGNWARFVDANNLQGICQICHNRKTAMEDGGFGNPVQKTNGPYIFPTGAHEGREYIANSVSQSKIDAALGTKAEIDDLLSGL